MSILHADNFSIYGTTKAFMLNGVYANIPTDGFLATDPDGVSPGYVLHFEYNSNLRYVLQSLTSTIGIAERVWLNQLPTAPTNTQVTPMILYDGSNTPLVSVNIDNTGRIVVWAGLPGIGANLGSTVNPVVTANGWYHIEAKFVQASGSSAIEVRVEGLPVLVLTGKTLANTNQFASVGVLNQNGPSTVFWYVKDYIVWDTNGTYNVDFLGTCLVTNLSTTSDNVLNWTPSAGTTGWDILDNIPPDDSKYISASTAKIGTPYVGNLSDLPADVTSVKALITYVRAAKTDGGDGSLQNGIVTGPGTVVNGANRPITIAQTYWRDVFEVNPDTSAPWLPAAVNASKVRINRTV